MPSFSEQRAGNSMVEHGREAGKFYRGKAGDTSNFSVFFRIVFCPACMATTISCKNCQTRFQGNYCPQCGQSAHTHRIDAHYMLHDIPHSILHVDKGLPYTFIQLCKNPGKALLDYLQGRRVRFFRPFAYVVILSTISALLLKFTLSETVAAPKNKLLSLIAQYPSILVFGLIPFVSLISWLVFRKKAFNYWEHFLSHTYLAAQINVILVIMHLLSLTGIFANAGLALKLAIFNGFFMTYHGYTFSALFTNNYREKFSTRLLLEITLCCFLLGSIYAMSLSFSGVATRWF
jgi:hypothetical protein